MCGFFLFCRPEDGDLQADCAPHQSTQAYHQSNHTNGGHEFPAFPLPLGKPPLNLFDNANGAVAPGPVKVAPGTVSS